MNTFSISLPRLLKAGIALLDPDTAAVVRVIAFQYNPDTLTRSLEVQGTGDASGRAEPLRLKGPPVETIKLEAEIDATDQSEVPPLTPAAEGGVSFRPAAHFRRPRTLSLSVEGVGIQPHLAALESIVYPSSVRLRTNDLLARLGTIEILPAQALLAVFVWSKNRVVPVRITEFSITEEAFDPDLNPIRAKVSLGLRVLSINDVGFDHPAGGLFLSYHQQKERLAAKHLPGTLAALGAEDAL